MEIMNTFANLGGLKLEKKIFWYCPSLFLTTKASPLTTSITWSDWTPSYNDRYNDRVDNKQVDILKISKNQALHILYHI